MNKSMKVLSILSVSLAGVSILFALSFLTIFWEYLCIVLFSPGVVIDIGPRIPIGKAIYIIGCLIFVVLLFIKTKSNNTMIIEIVSIVFLSVVFPILSWWLGLQQSMAVAFLGERHLYALTITNSVLVLPVSIMELSSALSLVICGMRMSEKVTNNVNNKNFMEKDERKEAAEVSVCKNYGAYITNNTMFCHKCGTKVYKEISQ